MTKKDFQSGTALFERLIRICLLCLPAVIVFAVSGCGRSEPDGQQPMTINTALVSKVGGLDPGNISNVNDAAVAAQFYECLFQYHYLKRPYELIPLLAAEMPEVSQDGLTYTIKIKHDVRFFDDECFEGGKGRTLKASDFIYSWKRLANVKYMCKNWWIFEGRIVGLDDFREYTKTCGAMDDVDLYRDVEGLQATDDYTIVIKLTQPWPQIIYALAHQPTAAVCPEAVEYYKKDIVNHPVGTGPFILEKWHRSSYISMVRNPQYHPEFYPSEASPEFVEAGLLKDAGARLPIADRIVMMVMEEDQPRWLQFLRGKLDAMSIPKDNYGQVIDPSRNLTDDMVARNIELKIYENPGTFWIGFNMEDPLLGQNKPLRKAISYSIDRQKYIDLFWNGRDKPAYGFIPPMMEAYDPDVKNYGIGYDPEKSRQLVEEAKKLAGGKIPEIVFTIGSTDTLSRQMGQFFKRCFETVGLDIKMEYVDWPTFLQKVKTKSVQMFTLGWIADYPDTENFLQVFYGPSESPGPNNFNYHNAEFDELFLKATVLPPSPERTKLYRQAERIVLDDCPAAFTNHRVAYVLHHDWIENYAPHVFQYGLAKYKRIDEEKRKEYQQLIRKLK